MPGNFPQTSDIVEVRCVMSALGQQVGMNVHHYVARLVVTGGCSCQELALAYDQVISPFYKNLLSSNAFWRGVAVRNLAPPKTIEFISNGFAAVGNSGPDLLPTQTRYLISKYSQLAGPENRGRVYPPFPPNTASDTNGVLTAGFLVVLQALASQLLLSRTIVGATGQTTFDPIIKHSGPYGPGREVVSVVARNRFATQRRSGAYGRQNANPF